MSKIIIDLNKAKYYIDGGVRGNLDNYMDVVIEQPIGDGLKVQGYFNAVQVRTNGDIERGGKAYDIEWIEDPFITNEHDEIIKFLSDAEWQFND